MIEQSPVGSVARAIDVLLFLEHGPSSLAKIAAATGLTKPTVHRLLATLSRGQLVIQDLATSDYMLGPGCLGIADAVLRGLGGLGMLARDQLERLSLSTQETVTLHVPAGTQRVCVAQVPSPQPVRYTSSIGSAKPIYTGAMGKVLLAFSTDDDRRSLLARMTLVKVTATTIVDPGELDAQLSATRMNGYAISRGEQAEGVAAISAPVFAAGGHVMAALSVLGPNDRLSDSVMVDIRPLIMDAAREISDNLGHRLGQSVVAGRR